MRKLITTVFVAALLLSPHFSILVSDIQAATRARGTVRAVDLAASTVTLALRDEGSLTLRVTEQTQITRNESPAILADLQQGDRATAYYDSTTLIAERIEARGEDRPALARVEGDIASVDTGSHKLTIDPTHGDPVTLNVTAGTEITLDNRAARLDDLQRGFMAAASYNPSTFEAARINAQSSAEVRGVIRDVGVANQSLTIATSTGEVVTLNVPPNTPISLNDRPASLDDLHRGFSVVASYLAGSLQAVRIAATSLAEVTGHIRSVDVGTATVVITPLVDGPAVELQVTGSTQITIGGERAAIDRLRAGMEARAVYNLTSFEAVEIAARPLAEECTPVRVAGTIRSVGDRTVTIGLGDGAGRVTINVVERTEITLDGRPARLSDLRAGMRAEAEFCRETLDARYIAAHSVSR